MQQKKPHGCFKAGPFSFGTKPIKTVMLLNDFFFQKKTLEAPNKYFQLILSTLTYLFFDLHIQENECLLKKQNKADM